VRQATFDRDARAAYIYIDDVYAHYPRETRHRFGSKTVRISEEVLIDVDASGHILGVELLAVDNFDGIQHEDITDR
jgi:uncharacterized protein YuzE